MPKFSIIIPTYNQAKLLRNCLDSIKKQTFNDYEVIVVDNCSPDNTRDVVESFDFPQSSFLQIKNEGIVARSRNMGIHVAKGEWICLLDSDDIWYPNKLEEVYKLIRTSPESDVVSHSTMWVNVQTCEKKIMTWNFKPDNLYEYMLRHGNKFQNSSISIRKDFLVNNLLTINDTPEFKSVEDYDFMLNLAFLGANFSYIKEPLGEYNVYGNNMSMSDFHLINLENVLRYHVYHKQLFEKNKDKLWNYVYSWVLLKKSIIQYRNKNYSLSIKLLYRAIVVSPARLLSYSYDRVQLLISRF